MDIFSHGLWISAIYRIFNKKLKKKFNLYYAFFWGIFPDLFAFTIPFIILLTGLISGTVSFQDIPRPEHIEPASEKMSSLFNLTHILYNLSHSLIIFILVISAVYLIHKFVLKSKRSILVMFGWLMHILIDIPTHSYAFYPTPFLWPISSYKFNGISWGTPWFLITNYIILIIVYYILYKRKVY